MCLIITQSFVQKYSVVSEKMWNTFSSKCCKSHTLYFIAICIKLTEFHRILKLYTFSIFFAKNVAQYSAIFEKLQYILCHALYSEFMSHTVV